MSTKQLLFSDTRNHKTKNTRYFKFHNWLLEQGEIMDMVESWRAFFIVEGRQNFILAKKRKLQKLIMKEWSKEAAVNYEISKKDLLGKIYYMDRTVEDRELLKKKCQHSHGNGVHLQSGRDISETENQSFMADARGQETPNSFRNGQRSQKI